MLYLRFLTYVVPVLFGFSTRKFFGVYFIHYTHFLIIVSIGLSWRYVDVFTWGITPILVALLVTTCLVSIMVTKKIIFAISAVIQEMCILSAVAITSWPMYPVIVLLFAMMHPTWFVRFATIALGSTSIFLFVYFETVLLSFSLHIIALTILMYFRSHLKLGYEYYPLVTDDSN